MLSDPEAVADTVMLEQPSECTALADDRRFRAVSVIAAIVCGLVGAGESMTTISAVLKMRMLFDTLGGSVPAGFGLFSGLGVLGLAVACMVVVVGVFVGFWWLARRYWVGLLFVPVFIYMGLGSIAVSWLAVAQLAVISNLQ